MENSNKKKTNGNSMANLKHSCLERRRLSIEIAICDRFGENAVEEHCEWQLSVFLKEKPAMHRVVHRLSFESNTRCYAFCGITSSDLIDPMELVLCGVGATLSRWASPLGDYLLKIDMATHAGRRQYAMGNIAAVRSMRS